MVESVNLSTIDPTDAATAEAARVAAATATFNAQAAVPAATPEPGAPLIGGKFKSTEDLLSAYKALESKLGAPKQPEAPVAGTPPAAAPTPPAPDALTIDATAAAASAGFKMDDLTAEYSANGGLTEATMAKLATAGFGKDIVDVFIEGQKSRSEALVSKVMSDSGVSKEAFASMVTWAQASLPANELADYNQAVAGSPAMQRFALEAMHTRFLRAQGSDPVLFRGERGVSNSSDVYRSTEQMLRDQANPLYSKDPAFRADVADKVARSKLS